MKGAKDKKGRAQTVKKAPKTPIEKGTKRKRAEKKEAVASSDEEDSSLFAKEVDQVESEEEPEVDDNTILPSDDEEVQEADEESEDEAPQRSLDKQILAQIDPSESEGEESSDEDEDVDDGTDGFMANKDLIALSVKGKKALKDKLENRSKSKKNEKGVIYLGRIPHGFYEDQMRQYFSQFGTVNRLRLSRNKKTGKSKHYAFIEFESDQVAQIVADTMDNYLLMGHILKCKTLAPSQIHPTLFRGANKKFKPIPWTKIARERHNTPKTPEGHQKLVSKLLKKENKKRKLLEEAGIDYDYKGYAAQVKPKPQHVKFD